jgi:hypothetical protein
MFSLAESRLWQQIRKAAASSDSNGASCSRTATLFGQTVSGHESGAPSLPLSVLPRSATVQPPERRIRGLWDDALLQSFPDDVWNSQVSSHLSSVDLVRCWKASGSSALGCLARRTLEQRWEQMKRSELFGSLACSARFEAQTRPGPFWGWLLTRDGLVELTARIRQEPSCLLDCGPQSLERMELLDLLPRLILQPEIVEMLRSWPIWDRVEWVTPLIEKAVTLLQCACDQLRSDPAFVLKAMQRNSHALGYASASLRDNEEFVRPLIAQQGRLLACAGLTLRSSKDIVLSAVRQDGLALQYADYPCNKDQDIVLEAVRNNGRALRHADPSLQDDGMIVKTAIRQNPYALLWASDRLRDDEEIVRLATSFDPSAIRYASDRLKLRDLHRSPIRFSPVEVPDDPEDEDESLDWTARDLAVISPPGPLCWPDEESSPEPWEVVDAHWIDDPQSF